MKKLLGWRQVRQIQNLNFDPQVYAQSLIKQGLSEQQAQGLISLVSHICDESMKRTTSTLLSNDYQSKFYSETKAELNKIRDDIRLLETQDFGRLTHKLEKLKDDIEHAKIEGAEQIVKLRSGFLLDMDLEKHRVEAEANELLLELDQASEKIQKEVDAMNLRMNQIKDSTRQGVAKGLGAIFISVLCFNLYEYQRKLE